MKNLKLTRVVLAVVMMLVVLGVSSMACLAGENIVIKWGNVFAPDMPFNQGVLKVAEVVAERSNNQIQIEFFPSSQLGNNTQLMAMLVQGTNHVGNEGGGFLSQWSPKFLVSEAVYAFKDIDHMFKVMRGPIGEEMFKDLLEKRGLRVIDVWYYGTRHVTSNKPIRTPQDMKGLKMRVPDGPLYIANGEALGAKPTPMTLSEVYLSLKTGVIDAQENPLPTINSFKFYEVQKYLILTGHNINFNVIMVNEKFWQGLTDEQRAIITDAVKKGGEYALELTVQSEKDLISNLEASGMTVIKPDIDAFRTPASDYMISKFSGKWGEGFYESVQEFD